MKAPRLQGGMPIMMAFCVVVFFLRIILVTLSMSFT